MNEELIQKISMLVDGELGEVESSRLIDKILKEDELREVWLRYHAVSTLLKSESGGVVSGRFSEETRHAVQAEPTVLAPIRTKKLTIKQTVFGAIAASVLVFAFVVGGFPNLLTQEGSTPVIVASFQSGAAQNKRLTVSHELAKNNLEEDIWIEDERLNDYLLKHNETTQSGGVFGVLPYARVVSYGSGR